MRLLLDTHVLLWVRADPGRLKPETAGMLSDSSNAVFVSVVSLWEILVTSRVGKIKADIAAILAGMAPAGKLQMLAIKEQHPAASNTLPFYQEHQDPFDHLLIAQAMSEDMMLVTQDRYAPLYSVRIVAP